MVLNGIEGETREYNGTDYTYHGPADCVVTENADGTVTYDIKLREDLKFSDGEPVTIDDVIFSMYVFLDPTYDGSVTMYSTPIVGLDEYRSSMTTLSKLIAEPARTTPTTRNHCRAAEGFLGRCQRRRCEVCPGDHRQVR